jgi:hypothetical protein
MPGATFEPYRRAWIAEGCLWCDGQKRPEPWSLAEPLLRAGIAKAS